VLLGHRNAPNPFNPLTRISYELDAAATVGVRVFDLSGRLVRTMLPPTRQDAGRHGVAWDGTDASGRHMASGIYLYRIRADEETRAGRMVLAR
jgi:flagellar hook assembly protein FlgD